MFYNGLKSPTLLTFSFQYTVQKTSTFLKYLDTITCPEGSAVLIISFLHLIVKKIAGFTYPSIF